MLYIYPYNLGSESARLLARKLNVKRVSGNRPLKRNSVVLRWGNTDPIRGYGRMVEINKPEAIALARNKISTLSRFKQAGVPTVEFTTDINVAKRWLAEDSFVYGRGSVTGMGGDGIRIITADDSYMPQLPLYTKAIPKAFEFRVHVFNNNVIDYTQKKRRENETANPYIKNFENGWVFCREGVTLPNIVRDAAIKAVSSLGLTFGACDVLYKERDNKTYVLEINTAPGIEGTTVDKYAEAIRSNYVY